MWTCPSGWVQCTMQICLGEVTWHFGLQSTYRDCLKKKERKKAILFIISTDKWKKWTRGNLLLCFLSWQGQAGGITAADHCELPPGSCVSSRCRCSRWCQRHCGSSVILLQEGAVPLSRFVEMKFPFKGMFVFFLVYKFCAQAIYFLWNRKGFECIGWLGISCFICGHIFHIWMKRTPCHGKCFHEYFVLSALTWISLLLFLLIVLKKQP